MTTMNKEQFGVNVRNFNFKEIFNYFGWNNDRVQFPPIEIENTIYEFKSIAEKSGFRVVECCPFGMGDVPTRNIRNRIESAFSQMSHDHIIIYTDSQRKVQVWQFVYRTLSQGTKRVEVEYDVRMNPEKIYERASGLVFELDEEENITIIDVIERVKGSLSTNAEKVTKKFYDYFKAQRKAMVDAIAGIDIQDDKEWYASLMINRLMFCYFIQKRRFLNNDMNYLNNKLRECQREHVDSFYSFYKNFLMVLFHDGLASTERNDKIMKTIGVVPYLNGGLFDIHALEKKYQNISIPDETFEKLFAFFDTWDWHLDSNNASSSTTEINPDILGYIFEKYINDRAKLGAYYTKEDITEYMARTAIVPALLDAVKVSYPLAFEPTGSFWSFLRDSGSKYIFEPVKYGVEAPAFVEPKKENYLMAASKDTDTGKENNLDVLRRHDYYIALLNSIQNGEIASSEQLVEKNLDVSSLLYDFINSTNDYGFIYKFYETLKSFTVLDPTCGSGAFLLAAINVLEPLYEACLSKFEFIAQTGDLASTYAYALTEIGLYNNAPDQVFWIFKQILSNNIYGVDIISEAVETAKLRLFLRLMACVEPDYTKDNLGIEPLPDLDYTLRHGNSLVGYTSLDEIIASAKAKGKLAVYQGTIGEITTKIRDANQLMDQFKVSQSTAPYDTTLRESLKEQIDALLFSVATQLDHLLHTVDENGDYSKWRKSSKPFHWFAMFNPIIEKRSGFDVVIGNPPYVKNAEITKEYSIDRYSTKPCGNVYTCFVERGTELSNQTATLSMILQLPIVCTDGMESARSLLFDKYNVLAFATFDDRPGKLFEELQHIRVAIVTGKKTGEKSLYTTIFKRWYSETRANLFKSIFYYRWDSPISNGPVAKIGDEILASILKKLNAFPKKVSDELISRGQFKVFYHNAPLYWIRGSQFAPYFYNEREGEKTSSQYKALTVANEKSYNLLLAILNSSLFYLWFVVYGDMRHLNRREIETFPMCKISDETNDELNRLLSLLMADYEKNKTRKECIYAKTGLVIYDEYHPKPSKPFMDPLDAELAKIYGLTDEELEYIINYDIKFRLGGANTAETDEL